LNPVFAQFVYANRSGLSIIDLDQTLPILRRTAALVRDVVKDDGVVVFVGTRSGMQRSLERAKERLGDNGYTTAKWMPGLLTNAETL
jgi:small subunit ribosomal protein S2